MTALFSSGGCPSLQCGMSSGRDTGTGREPGNGDGGGELSASPALPQHRADDHDDADDDDDNDLPALAKKTYPSPLPPPRPYEAR